MTASPHPGHDVLAHVRAALAPGAAIRLDEPDALTWWPLAYAQRVSAEPAEAVAGVPHWRVRAEITLVRGVHGGANAFATLARWNALRPGLSALRWDGGTNTVVLGASVWARPDDDGRAARLLASAALLQLGDAADGAAALAAELRGERADSAPPGGDVRADADPLVEGWRRFAAAGEDAAAWPRARLERAAAVSPPPWRGVQLDDGGLHAEITCGPAAAPGAAGDAPALLHLLTAQRHPRLGAGLLVVLRLPPGAEPMAAREPATAALLNEGEAREPAPADVLGAWCVHPAAGLAHVLFLPALLDAPDALERAAWDAGLRARWAMGFLAAVARLRPGG